MVIERERILERVRALLAKAESTHFEEEAAALTAKAQELIATHAIDLALLEEREGRGEVITRLLFIAKPYPKEKFMLLGGVARANNCRAILGLEDDTFTDMLRSGEIDLDDPGRWATLVGHESDLDSVELLFTSLLVQAVNVMLSHGSQTTPWGENRTRSFRRSFLNGFAVTISSRLQEARDLAREQSPSVIDSAANALPVLVRRESAVEDEVDRLFPQTSTLRTSVSNSAGVRAGLHAGQRADIGATGVGNRRRALT